MSSGRRPTKRDIFPGLVLGLLSALWPALPARGAAVGSSTGTLEFEITAPASLPPGFTLNPGGTIPGTFVFPDSSNSGAGSVTGLGSAACTPSGCTSPAPGLDLEYQLSTDLTCTSSPDGTYGGLEDTFALFGVSNMTGGSVALGLRFTTSWSVSASVTVPGEESASASIDILWAGPEPVLHRVHLLPLWLTIRWNRLAFLPRRSRARPDPGSGNQQRRHRHGQRLRHGPGFDLRRRDHRP